MKKLVEKNKRIKKLVKINGITLIALIVTIVVLLILAGIVIMQLNNNGILKNTKLAKERYTNSQKDENATIDDYSNQIDNYGVAGNGRDNVITPKKVEITILKSDYKIDYNDSYVIGNILYLNFGIGKNSNFVSGWDKNVLQLTDVPKCSNILTLNTSNGSNTGEIEINHNDKSISIFNNGSASLVKTGRLLVQGSYYIGE